jgi:hypothetical protein
VVTVPRGSRENRSLNVDIPLILETPCFVRNARFSPPSLRILLRDSAEALTEKSAPADFWARSLRLRSKGFPELEGWLNFRLCLTGDPVELAISQVTTFAPWARGLSLIRLKQG